MPESNSGNKTVSREPVVTVKRNRDESNSPPSDNRPATKKHTMDQEILKAINGLRSDMSTQLSQINAKIDNIEKTFAQWSVEKEAIVTKQRELEARLDRIERKEKQQNIIITGMPFIKGNATQVRTAVNELLAEQMKCPISVTDAFQIRLKSGDSRVIAKLPSMEDKKTVMKAKNALPDKIFIQDDLIRKDQFVQFKAREFAKIQRAQKAGETKIGNGKVFVDGVPFIWNEDTQTFVSRKN